MNELDTLDIKVLESMPGFRWRDDTARALSQAFYSFVLEGFIGTKITPESVDQIKAVIEDSTKVLIAIGLLVPLDPLTPIS